MLCFGTAIAAYRALLAANPGKALRVDSNNLTFMLDGELVGYYDGPGVLDEDRVYDLDSSAWDDAGGCWSGADDQTQAAIDHPIFTDIPRSI